MLGQPGAALNIIKRAVLNGNGVISKIIEIQSISLAAVIENQSCGNVAVALSGRGEMAPVGDSNHIAQRHRPWQ